jgi:hypothetical protein
MNKRTFFVPLGFSFIGFWAFLRSPGADQVRAVQIVLLIAVGACLGASFVMFLQRKKLSNP